MTHILSPKKVFKEKTSIKKELAKALETNTILTTSMLAKLVGISIYRVRKYCKNHNIDLDNYNSEIINQKKAKSSPKKEQKKKINIGEQNTDKINVGKPVDIKYNID